MLRRRFLLLVLPLALTACSADDPTPQWATATRPPHQATPGQMPTGTRPVEPTHVSNPVQPSATPTVPPTPWWGNPPVHPAEEYRLSEWNASDALGWAQADLAPYPTDYLGRSYVDSYAAALVSTTLYQESMLVDPASPAADVARRALLDPATRGNNTSPSVEPLRVEMERILNATQSEVLDLAPLNEALDTAAGSDGLDVTSLQSIDNLLGDGAPGWVIEVHASYDAAILLAIRQPGAYLVLALQPNWMPDFHNDFLVAVQDLNANGVPEVTLTDRFSGSGFSHYCYDRLAAYEWLDGRFINLTPGLAESSDSDAGECLPFDVVPATSGPAEILAGVRTFTHCEIRDDWATASVVLQRRFTWNGAFFDLADETILPFPESSVGDPALAACALAWADEAGPEAPGAQGLMKSALAEQDPATIQLYNQLYGPAFRDYFAFKLGVWLALAGDDEEARTQLSAVRDRPTRPDYTAAGRLASAFLTAFETKGTYAGCTAVADVLDPGDFPLGSDSWLVFFDHDAMRASWGFVGPDWATGGEPEGDGPLLQRDTLNLCSLVSAFRMEIERWTITTTPSLVAYLTARQIPYTGLQEADVDGDGRLDWLLLVGTGGRQSLQLWVLLNQPSGIEAEWVGGSYTANTSIPTTAAAFAPHPEAGVLTIYQWPSDLAVLRAIKLTTSTRVVDLVDSALISTGTQLGFSIAADPAHPGTSTLTVSQADRAYWDPSEITLDWVSDAHELAVVDRDGGVARQQLTDAERKLFVDHDPVAANAILSELVHRIGDLPAQIEPNRGALPTFWPYVLYLRALAAERSGNTAEAIETYWTLWNNYALDPFSAIAQLKLALIAP